MELRLYSVSQFRSTGAHPNFRAPLRRCFFNVRSSMTLPISEEKAKYYKELTAAIDVVERACRLCIDVKKSLFSRDGRILEKNDQTPVTIADFGVQALVSLEMSKLFPSIPLVAEEDSAFLHSNNLVDAVVDVVTDKATCGDQLMQDDVLRAIDRGGKDAHVFGPKPATYWVLDPIDGTRGFVKGSEALYVVGLALVVDGEIVLGVMGCPNWQESHPYRSTAETLACENSTSRSGMLMVSHIGCGTWRKTLCNTINVSGGLPNNWIRCLVDDCQIVQKARYCIQDSQTWDSLPLSAKFGATSNAENIGNNQILLIPTCCGRIRRYPQKEVHDVVLLDRHPNRILSKYLLLASGRGSVYILRAKTRLIKSWDHAVGIICVHEAGGKVTDWRGHQIDFAADQVERRVIFPSGGVLAANDSLHSQILLMIS